MPVLASFWPDRIRFPSGGDQTERFQGASNQIANLVRRATVHFAVLGCGATVVSAVLALSLRSENRLANYVPPGSRALESYSIMQQQFNGAGSIYALLEWDESLKLNSAPVLSALDRTQTALANQTQLGPPLSLLDLLHSLPGSTSDVSKYRVQFSHLKYVPPAYLRSFVRPEHRQTAVGARVPDIGADALNQVVAKLQSEFDDHPTPGVSITIVGPTVSMARSFARLIQDLISSLVLATLLIFLLMTFLFRSIWLGAICAMPNAFALLGVGACLVLTNTPLQMVSILCFTVCLGISVDDTIHFMLRYLQHHRGGSTIESATMESIREVGPALIVTTFVFVGGNAVVLLSRIPVLNTFAWLSCLSLLLAVIADLFFLPALVLLLGSFQSSERGDAGGAVDHKSTADVVKEQVAPTT